MLYSEVANLHGLPNIPDDPDLAIAAGEKLCCLILEPLRRAFGHVAVRSAYRSPSVNDFCHQRYTQGDKACFCSDNDYNGHAISGISATTRAFSARPPASSCRPISSITGGPAIGNRSAGGSATTSPTMRK